MYENNKSSTGITPSTEEPNLTAKQKFRLPLLYCYPHAESSRIVINAARDIHVGKTPLLEVLVYAGPFEVEDCKFTLKPATGGLRLRTRECIAAQKDLQLEQPDDTGALHLRNLVANTSATLLIPYDTERKIQQIDIRVDADYHIGDQVYKFFDHAVVNTGLLLDVNVQDIFKEDALFAKFTMHPVPRAPIRLLSAELKAQEAPYAVQPFAPQFDSVIAMPDDLVPICFKVTQSIGSTDESNKSGGALLLEIQYRTVLEDVIDTALQQIRERLQEQRLASLVLYLDAHVKRVLAAAVIDSLQDSENLETHMIKMPEFDAMDWTTALSNLPVDEANKLETCLKQWHEDHPYLELPDTDDLASYIEQFSPRTLLIDYDIPRLDYLFVASISLSADLSITHRHGSPIIVAGHVIDANVKIRQTNKWKGGSTSTNSSPLFVYEVHAEPNKWLIAGSHHQAFTAAKDNALEFSLQLIPLECGFLPLPSVEVRVSRDGEHGRSAASEIAVETDCWSQAQGVWVVEGMKSTTFGVGQEGLIIGTPTLLESRASQAWSK